MQPIVPIPSASDMLSQVGSSSAPMFQSFLPLGYIEAGLAIGALVVVFLVGAIVTGIGRVVHWEKKDKYS